MKGGSASSLQVFNKVEKPVTAQSPSEKSKRQSQAAGVGLAQACTPQQSPHGWHTLDIECKGVLSIGI